MDNKEFVTNVAGMYFLYKLIPIIIIAIIFIIIGLYIWMNPSNCKYECDGKTTYKNALSDAQCKAALDASCKSDIRAYRYTGN